ncbi:MAG TPA: hypothetical protein VE078_00165 [Thermoanaerobaculia bacterium]|nr:hypothetical protein [Thermoanaerobaculia bacterium]
MFRLVRIAVFVTIVLLIVVAGFGNAVKQLWNWLMPALFGLPAIHFWQAVGLLSLSWLLFGGWRGFGHGRPWRYRMRERWENMTPEERERFRTGMESRCGRRFRSSDEEPGLSQNA